MDYRNREYYLVKTDASAYEMRHSFYKQAAPSLKRSPPYNHFYPPLSSSGRLDYDARQLSSRNIEPFIIQELLSCKIEESEALEYELRKAARNDKFSCFLKGNKAFFGQ